MESLAQIQTKLKNVMITSNMESPELDSLCLLLANSIYNNQVNVTSAAIEMSPSKCIQLNSSIVHARDKGYSVFRGRNPHFRIKNAYVTKTHDMSKYSVFAETNNYKLVLAKDYSSENQLTGDRIELEVILTKDVLTESFTAEGLYSHTLSGTGISEDISLFMSNGNSTDAWKELTLVRSIEDIGQIPIGEDSKKIAVITDTDYTCALYNVTKFKSDYAYICKYLPLISNDVGDTTEIMSKFKSFNGFALKRFMLNGVEVTKLDYEALDDTGNVVKDSNNPTFNYVSPRETSKDNIYLNSIYAFTTIHKICTENDIVYLFKSYKDWSKRTKGVKCIFIQDGDKTKANLSYVINSLDADIDYVDLTIQEKAEFLNYITTAYYLDSDTLVFTTNEINEVHGDTIEHGLVSGISTPIKGRIIVHAVKNVITEVTKVGNDYVKSNYSASRDYDPSNRFCPAQWIAAMQKVDGVDYIEVVPTGLTLDVVLSNKVYNSFNFGKYIEDYIIGSDQSSIGFSITMSEDV